MKRQLPVIKWLVFPGLLALPGAAALANSSAPPQQIQLVQTMDCDGFAAWDCNGDGWSEVITIGPPQEGISDRLVRFDYTGGRWNTRWQLNLIEGRIENAQLWDLNRDQKSELIVALRVDGEVWLEVYDPANQSLEFRSAALPTPDLDGSGSWGGGFQVMGCADLDGDGILDILACIGAGFDLDPRALLGFSGATGKLLREYPTAGPPGWLHVVNAEDTETARILIRTGTVDNGRRVGPFDDRNGYLIVLDAAFEPQWWLRGAGFHEPWAYVVGDLDSDGEMEVVIAREREEGGAGAGHRLEVRDLESSQIERYLPLNAPAEILWLGDLDRDARPELLVALANGTLRRLDPALEAFGEHRESAPLRQIWVGDLNRDGEREIALLRGSSTLVLLDHQLQPLAERELPGRIRKLDGALAGPDTHLLLAMADDLHMLALGNAKAGIGDLAALGRGKFALLLILALAAGGGLGAWGALRFARGRRRELRRRDSSTRQIQDELLTKLATFGHSGVARRNLERLVQYGETMPAADDTRRELFNQRFDSICDQYEDYTRPLLKQIVGSAARLDAWQPAAESLREHLQNIEAILNKNGRRVAAKRITEKEGRRLAADGRAILDESRVVRRGLFTANRTDVLNILSRVLAAEREQFARFGLEKVRVHCEGTPQVEFDGVNLQTCLEILLNNAIEAMSHASRRELEISVEEKGRHVEIRIADSGEGISRERWEEIFERGKTSKGSEHGIGLYLARELLAKFSATLQVGSSELGMGTVMIMRLRTADRRDSTSKEIFTQGAGSS